MKILFEPFDVEDFMEIHLTKREILGLLDDEAVAKDWPNQLQKKRNLNICIRKEPYAT